MEPMDMDEHLIPREKKIRDNKFFYGVIGLLAGCIFTFGVSYLCFTLGKEKRIEKKSSDVFNSTVLQLIQTKLDQQGPQTGRNSDNGVNSIKAKQDEIINLFKDIKSNNSRDMENIKQLVKTETANSKDEIKRVMSDSIQNMMTKDDSNALLQILQKVKNDTQRENIQQMISNASQKTKDSLNQLMQELIKQVTQPQNDIGSQVLQYLSNMTQTASQQTSGAMDQVGKIIQQMNSLMNMSLNSGISGLPLDVTKMQRTVVEAITNATSQIIALIKDTREELMTGKKVTSTIKTDTSTTAASSTVSIPKQDCQDWYRAGSTTSGIYSISLDTSDNIDVYCDMATDGGGWLVFQRRTDGSENFDRGWTDYENGFGNKSDEFWLGNKYLHLLTKNPTEIRIDLTDWVDAKRYAKYSTFRIGDETSKYTLYVTGYSGDAGDGLNFHHELKFSTKDQDNEKGKGGCAASLKGGWWYDFCAHSSLNGEYINGGSAGHNKGINWQKWKGDNYSMKYASMMLRRK